jgi:hypothetical protein
LCRDAMFGSLRRSVLSHVKILFLWFVSLFCSCFAMASPSSTEKSSDSCATPQECFQEAIKLAKRSEEELRSALKTINTLQNQFSFHRVFHNEPMGNELKGLGLTATRSLETHGGDLMFFVSASAAASDDATMIDLDVEVGDRSLGKVSLFAVRKLEPKLLLLNGALLENVKSGIHLVKLKFGPTTLTNNDTILNVTAMEIPRSLCQGCGSKDAVGGKRR